MTAATLAHLPIEFGGSLLSSTGRMALALAARYMRAPLANTGIAALVAMSALAASNAMYLQPHAHPAPLFGTEATDPQVTDSVEPVVPMSRPSDLKFANLPTLPVEEKAATRPVSDASDDGPVGNKDVFEVQRKLEVLRLFSGTIDGYYGPQTARAIKKFQELVGLKPTGELTRDLVERVRNAPMTLGDTGEAAEPAVALPAAAPVQVMPAAIETAPAPQPLGLLPATVASTRGDPVRVDPSTLAELPPLPTPEPLVADIQTGAIQKQAPAAATADERPTVLGRPVPTTAEGALEMAANTAGEAFDTIMSGVQALTAPQPAAPQPAAYLPPKKVASIQPAQPAPAAVPVPTVQQPMPTAEVEAAPSANVANDPLYVAKVQRGLASLGFLHGPADGVAGEATAKAVRNFETYFNYDETGRITPGLLDLLVKNGASI